MAAFREVMRTGSVSEAARNLNRTQPSLSHQIAKLETELGMPLFERRRGRLVPVPEAKYLFRECDDLLNRVGSVSQTMRRMKGMESGELRIVSMPGPAAVLIPELICEQIGPKPDVGVTLLTRSSDSVVQLLESQQYDVGLADHRQSPAVEDSLVQTLTITFESVCAVPSKHRLASKPSITAQDLSGLPMASLYDAHQSHILSQSAFYNEGAAFNVRFTGQYFMPLLAYVERDLAFAIIDPLAAESWRRITGQRKTVVFRPFKPIVSFKLDVLTPVHRPSSMLATAFRERVISLFADLGGVK